jgi:DNA modification methylase
MLIQASAHQIPLPDGSVHAVVTSPPFFGLRRYVGERDLAWPAGAYSPCTGAPLCVEVPAISCPFGNEPTIELYVWHSLLILRELRRVLRDDGVLWWDLGDSYSQEDKWGGESGAKNRDSGIGGYSRDRRLHGVPQGNLLGIPHRVMLAAQADGWTVRNDCVWAKVTPMPESMSGWRWERCRVKVAGKRINGGKKGEFGHGAQQNGQFDSRAQYADCPGCDKCQMNDGLRLRRGGWRHTRAHEFVLQMVKSSGYWSDGEIVREPLKDSSIQRMTQKTFDTQTGGQKDSKEGNRSCRKALENLRGRLVKQQDWAARQEGWSKQYPGIGRNPRSVLQPAPSPYSGAHFAVYPPELIRPLILSSVPRRCCPRCDRGWAAILEGGFTAHTGKTSSAYEKGSTANRLALLRQAARERGGEYQNSARVVGYRPTCSCDAKAAAGVPGIVLDPFCGSGTTGEVARECGVRFVGLDISFEYLDEHAMWRAERRHSLDLINGLPLFSAQG